MLILDDAIYCDEKVEKAGDATFGAWVKLCAYCNHKMTDGWVSREMLARILGKRWREKVKRMQEARFIDSVTKEGAWLHDFLEHHPSKAQRIEKMAADRIRHRKDPTKSPLVPSSPGSMLVRSGPGMGPKVDPKWARNGSQSGPKVGPEWDEEHLESSVDLQILPNDSARPILTYPSQRSPDGDLSARATLLATLEPFTVLGLGRRDIEGIGAALLSLRHFPLEQIRKANVYAAGQYTISKESVRAPAKWIAAVIREELERPHERHSQPASAPRSSSDAYKAERDAINARNKKREADLAAATEMFRDDIPEVALEKWHALKRAGE